MASKHGWTLCDDGTLDTVLECEHGIEHRFDMEHAAAYRDEHTGELDLDSFVEGEECDCEDDTD